MHGLIVYCTFLTFAVNGNDLLPSEAEAFRNLAQKFVPVKLADQLAKLVYQNNNKRTNVTETLAENGKQEVVINNQNNRYKGDYYLGNEGNAHYQRAHYDEFEMIDNAGDVVENTGAHEENDGYELDETYQLVEQGNVDNNEYYDQNEKQNDDEQEEENDRVPNEDEDQTEEYVEETEQYVQERAVGHQFSPPKKTVRIDLDELVEKVKERILVDLKRDAELRNLAKKHRKKIETGLTPSHEHPVKLMAQNKRPSYPQKERSSQISHLPQNRKPTRSERHVLPNRQRFKKVQTNKEVSKEYIEKSDLFDTVKLNVKGKRDSYEDYKIPPKEYDVYESGESLKIHNEPANRHKPRHSKSPTVGRKKTVPQKKVLEPKEMTEIDTKKIDQREKHSPQNYNSRQIKTTKHYPKKLDITPHYRDHKKQINYRTTTESVETTTDIYEDDGMRKRHTTLELKARTENIGDDRPSEEDKDRKGKKHQDKTESSKKKHHGTDIPTRQTYKMTSPDYYNKLPRIAEKYNFNEPIPEKDREVEDTRQIFKNPGARINKKVKVE